MMNIHIRLHGALRDKLPAEAKGQTTLSLAEGATVTAVLTQLSLRGHLQVALNQAILDDNETTLKDGDTLEVFRPAAGG